MAKRQSPAKYRKLFACYKHTMLSSLFQLSDVLGKQVSWQQHKTFMPIRQAPWGSQEGSKGAHLLLEGGERISCAAKGVSMSPL